MKAPASCAALHPKGERFVVGSTDFGVRMYGMDGTLQHTLHGHHGPVHWVSMAPDGKTFASGYVVNNPSQPPSPFLHILIGDGIRSDDGTVRLWQNEIEEYGLWTLPSQESESAPIQ